MSHPFRNDQESRDAFDAFEVEKLRVASLEQDRDRARLAVSRLESELAKANDSRRSMDNYLLLGLTVLMAGQWLLSLLAILL